MAADRVREGVWTVAFGVRLGTSTDISTRFIGFLFEHEGYRLLSQLFLLKDALVLISV